MMNVCKSKFRATSLQLMIFIRLPVFASVGFQDTSTRKRQSVVQCAPASSCWLDILSLLVDHGASIHESVFGRTLTMAYLDCATTQSWSRLRFLRLLGDEYYQDFDGVD